MAVKGSLSEASFTDVLQLLTFSNRAGCLSVTDGRNFGNVFIRDAGIIYANLINRRDRLGDVLVTQKKITQEALEQALTRQKEQKKRLGEVLIEMGVISREDLEHYLRYQIEEVIFQMLTWETGYFSFEPDLLPPVEEFAVFITPQELLLEGARRIGEWKKLEGKLPPFDTVLKQKPLDRPLAFTEDEKKIITLIDGERTIDEIVKVSEFDFFATCRTLYGLFSAGILEKPDVIPVEKGKGSVEEHKNLGYAFFKTEMYDEAEREYRRILEIELENSEANFYLGLIDMKQGSWATAVNYLEKSLARERRANTLNNIGVVYEKLERWPDAVKAYEEAFRIDPKNKKALVNLGRYYFRNDDLDQAKNCFIQALEIDNILYGPYCYLLLTYHKLGDRLRAEAIVNEGRDKFAQGSEFLLNCAVFNETIGRAEEAEKLYRRVIEIAPTNVVGRLKLADFYYREELFGAAREEYERVPEPKRDFGVYYRLGNIYLKQGDKSKALVLWEKAYQLNPQDTVLIKNLEILRSASS